MFEPPGETHTLVVPEGCDEMITMFHVQGSLNYCDERGDVIKSEDVFDKPRHGAEALRERRLGRELRGQLRAVIL